MVNMKEIRAFLHDAKAVSPAIATLILIVIAAVAAAGVGILVQSSQKNAQDQTGNQNLGAMGTLNIKGSTTLLPIEQLAAPIFAKKYPAIDMKIVGGGSELGLYTAWTTESPSTDVGASSSIWAAKTYNGITLPTREVAVISLGGADAKVTETKIGSGMIVVAYNGLGITNLTITNSSVPTSNGTNSINFADLKDLYTNGNNVNITTAFGPVKAVQRSDASGTEETFAKWIGLQDTNTKQLTTAETLVAGYQGNQGVRDAIAAATTTNPIIGFVDVGFTGTNVNGNQNVHDAAMKNTTSVSAKTDSKGVGGPYDVQSNGVNTADAGLARDLYFYTQGTPTGAVKAWLDWITGAEGQKTVVNAGFFSN